MKKFVTAVILQYPPSGLPGEQMPKEVSYFVGYETDNDFRYRLCSEDSVTYKKSELFEAFPEEDLLFIDTPQSIDDSESVFMNTQGFVLIARKHNPIGDEHVRMIGKHPNVITQ